MLAVDENESEVEVTEAVLLFDPDEEEAERAAPAVDDESEEAVGSKDDDNEGDTVDEVSTALVEEE